MTSRTYTVSLPVLASMLEAGTIDSVTFSLHGVTPNDDGSAHFSFTPEDLRSFYGSKNQLLCIRETKFEHTGNRRVKIGHGHKNYVMNRNWHPPDYP